MDFNKAKDKIERQLKRGRLQDWYRFELLAALDSSTIPWYEINPEVKNSWDLPKKDTGIDSASETIAVQSKYRTTSTVKWDEIAKFLACSQHAGFKEKLLYTTEGTRVSKVLNHTYQTRHILLQEEEEEIEVNEQEEEIEVDEEIKQKCEINVEEEKVDGKLISIYEKIQDDVMNTYDSEADEYKIRLPCGSGKSFLIGRLVQLHSKKTLILVPSLLLLEQVYNRLKNDFSISSLCRVGTGYEVKDAEVYISVYNSIEKLTEIGFGLCIIDEAHHVLNSKNPDSYIGGIRELVKKTKTVYLSATLKEPDYNFDFREAIDIGLLADYDIVIPAWKLKPKIREIANYIKSNLNQYRYTVAYSNSCSEAKEFHDVCEEIGLRSVYIDGTMTKKEKCLILSEFRHGDYDIISSVNVLGEGVDLPIANTCLFVNTRASEISIIQCVGRVLRLHEEKILSHVIIPCSQDSEDREYKKIMKALYKEDSVLKTRTMTSNHRVRVEVMDCEDEIENELISETIYDSMGKKISDVERWNVRLSELKEFVKKEDRLPKDREGSLGKWCNNQRQNRKNNKLLQDRIDLLEQISCWYWKKEIISWDSRYSELISFIESEGRLPKQKETLGRWRDTQKQEKRKNNLSQERIDLLEKISCWYWEKEDLWYLRLIELEEFIEIEGRLPKQSEGSLGKWCNNQKQDRKKNKLSQERIDLLEKIPCWYWKKEDPWNNMYSELVYFVRKEDRLPKQREGSLGTWCDKQKQAGKNNKLSQDKIDLLEQISCWYWTKESISWDGRYSELVYFVQKEDRLPKQREGSLGTWCNKQRQGFKNNKLSQDRIDLLEKISCWYWSEGEIAPPTESKNEDDLSTWSYRELQKKCKELKLKAVGKKDVLLERLKEYNEG